MKKFFYVAIAATALASCSSDNLVDIKEGDEIKITAVADNDSRAADVYCNNNLPNSFYVWANNSSSKAFMAGDLYKNDGANGTTYTSNVVRYWPEDGALNFFALNTNAVAYTNGGVPSIEGFVPETTVGNQFDIVYATTMGATKPNSGGAVAMNFRHALSQIEFQAKNTNPTIEVEIEEVVVGNAIAKGSFVLPQISTTDKYGEHNGGTTANTTIAAQGVWTLGSEVQNYIVTSISDAAILHTADDPTNLTCATGADALTPAKDWSKTMLLLPQASTTAWNKATVTPVVDGAGTNGTYLGVKCRIYNVVTVGETKERTLIYGGNDGKWALVPVLFNWQQGKKYVYTFVFAAGENAGLTPDGKEVLENISLEVTVDDFILGEQPADTEMNAEPVQNN